jgi:hypothetical protein
VSIVQLDDDTGEFAVTASFDHPYPTTKVMFSPDLGNGAPDLLGTTGDYMRIWEIDADGTRVKMKALLNNNKNSEFCAPVAAFDWNEVDPSVLGTASIDTTCTIWDIETMQAKTQLIAHDKEVYDIAFMKESTQIFASVGADGSVRMFDLRSLGGCRGCWGIGFFIFAPVGKVKRKGEKKTPKPNQKKKKKKKKKKPPPPPPPAPRPGRVFFFFFFFFFFFRFFFLHFFPKL